MKIDQRLPRNWVGCGAEWAGTEGGMITKGCKENFEDDEGV